MGTRRMGLRTASVHCARPEVALFVLSLFLISAAPAAAAGPQARAAAEGPAPPSQRLQLVLPLVARTTGLARLAAAVSTPGSPQYGHYLSIPVLSKRFGASSSVRRRVVRYLRAVRAADVGIDATGLFADATMTARAAARLFGTPLARFRRGQAARFIAPTRQVRIPGALRGAVKTVVGLDTEALARSQPSTAVSAGIGRAHAAAQPTSALPRTGTPSGCPRGVTAGELGGNPGTAGFTPNQYLTAYGFDQLHRSGLGGEGQRVALIEIDGFKRSDITTFAQCFGLNVPPINGFRVGGRQPLPPGGESTLDLEALDAAAPQLKSIDVYETNANAASTLRSLTAPLQNRHRKPQVISVSLGLCEPAAFGAIGIRGFASAESGLEMAALSGVTLLAASGDSGSADCTAPDGTPLDRLAVNYPASSWWVTAVGGSNFLLNPLNQITREVVWNDTDVQPGSGAGGGSSEVFARPFYQDGTIKAKSRALPDVSLLADIIPGYAVYCSASRDCVDASNPDPWQAVGGTSAATPLLAGGLALVDQSLRMHRRQDLGLVDPLLYQVGRSGTLSPGVFNDIRSYGNDVGPYIPGARQPLGCCSATPGFDRASGWGSMNLASFAPIAVAMQPGRIALSLPRQQRPVRTHRILARITCTAACRIGAYAVVRIAHAKSFTVKSRVFRLRRARSKVLRIGFSAKQRRRLRAALGHRSITATVFGVEIAGRGRIQFQTAGKKLKIVG